MELLVQRIIVVGIEVLLGGLLLRWLWDYTMPQLFGLRQAPYWLVVCLLLMFGVAVFLVHAVAGVLAAALPLG